VRVANSGIDMQFGGMALLGLVVVAGGLVSPRVATAASLDIAAVPPAVHLSEPAAALTADARYVADWALQSNDNQHRPFAVVDKKAARIYVPKAVYSVRPTHCWARRLATTRCRAWAMAM
jgi:hypothetical protein